MNTDIQRWLAHLPVAEERVGDGFILTGWLLPIEAGVIRMVVGDLCLSFSPDDILDVEPVGVTEQIGPTPSTRAARVSVRRGASLLDARPGLLIDGPSPPRLPFALSTRSLTVTLDPSPRYRDLERQFLLSQSLIDP